MRTVRLAILAFLLGFGLVAGGWSQSRFLFNAWSHAGF